MPESSVLLIFRGAHQGVREQLSQLIIYIFSSATISFHFVTLGNFLKIRQMVIDPLIEEPLAIGLGCDLEEVQVQGTITATPNVNTK